MRHDSRSHIWPLLIILAFAFVWQVRAPRTWYRVALAPTDELLSVGTIVGEPQLAQTNRTGASRTGAEELRTGPELAGESEAIGTASRTGTETFTAQSDATIHVPLMRESATRHTWTASYSCDLAPQELAVRRVRVDRDATRSSRVPEAARVFDPLEPLFSSAAISGVSAPVVRYPTISRGEDTFSEDPLSAEALVNGPAGAVTPTEAEEDGPGFRETAPPAEAEFLREEQKSHAVRSRLAIGDPATAGPRAGESSLPRRSLARENLTDWPYPAALLARLDRLTEFAPHHAIWSQRVQRELLALSQLDSLGSTGVARTLERLQDHARHGQSLAERTEEESVRNALARAVHGLRRRLAVWQRIHDVAAARESPKAIYLGDSLQLRQVLNDLEASLENVRHRRDWMEYLQVAEARRLENAASALDTATTRQIAQGILGRLEYARLSPAQRRFLEQPAFQAYSRELKHLAAEPVDYRGLMHQLEDYETRGLTESAHWVARAQQNLRWSHQEPVVRLGREVDAYYRNANFRVAVSADMLRRLMPEPHSREEPIDEHILGIRTRGRSESLTRVHVGFQPSDSSWQLRLLANGQVASLTTASQGPATFYTRGRSEFQAEKPITIDGGGIRWGQTDVWVDSDTALAGLRTDADNVPLLGDIVQNIATRQYRSRTPAAEREAKQLLAHRVRTMLDQEVEKSIQELQDKFRTHFYRPLYHLALNPVALEMRTTEARVIARYRLAGPHQLGAHTPRPLAPADSVLSVQMHESSLNNLIEQLGWQGRRMPLRDVYCELAQLFGLPDIQPPDDLPEDVIVRFAKRNPLRLAFEDGRVRITLGLAELSQGRHRWRNFVVRVHYQPVPEDPQVDLVRDQYVELMGRLRLGDQIALRGIFSRVFSREKPIRFITRYLKDDPRMHGLALTRMEIGDGWLAVAIGPRQYFRRAFPLPVALRIAD